MSTTEQDNTVDNIPNDQPEEMTLVYKNDSIDYNVTLSLKNEILAIKCEEISTKLMYSKEMTKVEFNRFIKSAGVIITMKQFFDILKLGFNMDGNVKLDFKTNQFGFYLQIQCSYSLMTSKIEKIFAIPLNLIEQKNDIMRINDVLRQLAINQQNMQKTIESLEQKIKEKNSEISSPKNPIVNTTRISIPETKRYDHDEPLIFNINKLLQETNIIIKFNFSLGEEFTNEKGERAVRSMGSGAGVHGTTVVNGRRIQWEGNLYNGILVAQACILQCKRGIAEILFDFIDIKICSHKCSTTVFILNPEKYHNYGYKQKIISTIEIIEVLI